MQLNSRIIILVQAPGSSVIYVTFFKNNIFVQFLCNVIYAFKRLVGEMKLTTILVFKIRLKTLYF